MSRSASFGSSLLAVVAAATCILLGAPTGALASRAPSDSELNGIVSAATTDCSAHQQDCVIAGAIVSDVDDEYAWASGKGATADYDALLSSTGGGGNDWTVIMVQTQGAVPRPCSDYDEYDVPPQVLNDLGIPGTKPGSTKSVTCGTPVKRPKVCSSATVSGLKLGISSLSYACSKARKLAISAQKHGGKAPSGWALIRVDACTGALVQRKYRKVRYPLLEVPKGKPVIYVDDESSTACGGDGGAAGTTSASA